MKVKQLSEYKAGSPHKYAVVLELPKEVIEQFEPDKYGHLDPEMFIGLLHMVYVMERQRFKPESNANDSEVDWMSYIKGLSCYTNH